MKDYNTFKDNGYNPKQIQKAFHKASRPRPFNNPSSSHNVVSISLSLKVSSIR